MPDKQLRVLVQVGHESPRQPGHEGATGAAGEVEVGREIGAALVGLLEADPRFEPRLIPGKVPRNVVDGSFPVDAFLALHCDGSNDERTDGWALGYPDGATNKRLADEIRQQLKRFHRSDQLRDNHTVNMSGYYAYALVPTAGPEVLVEHGFVSNPTERRWLHRHADRLAEASYLGLLAYFGLDESEDSPATMTRTTTAQEVTPASTIVAPPRATARQLRRALLSREHGSYTDQQVRRIVDRYVETATGVGVDPLVAVAQLVLETGNLTSFWSQPPRRNPAGIGVTGEPGVGLSFASWSDAVAAHVGRLLAYAVQDGRETPAQRALVEVALAVRPLPADRRGAAPRLKGLAGRWATDPDYAAKIARIATSIATQP